MSRNYKKWVLSQLICALSKTPEQEIITITKTKDGEFILTINGQVEIAIKDKKEEQDAK